MATTADLKNGMYLMFNGKPCVVVYFQHVKPGKGPAFVKTKLRNLENGRILENTFTAGVKLDTISVERREDIVYIGGNPAPQVLNNFELEAEIDTRAIVVPLSDFEALLHSDLRIENTVLRAVLGLFNAILFAMQNFLFLDLSQRLAAHLLFEYSQQGSLSLATTHQRIANSIASSREVVSRMLKQWEHADIVRLSRGRVIIRDAAVLRRLSEE